MVSLSYLPKQMEMITLKKSASRLNSMTVLGRMSPVPSSETAVNGNIEFNWLQWHAVLRFGWKCRKIMKNKSQWLEQLDDF